MKMSTLHRKLNGWLEAWRVGVDHGKPDSLDCQCSARRVALWMRVEVDPPWTDKKERDRFVEYCDERNIRLTADRDEQRLIYDSLHLRNPTAAAKVMEGEQVKLTLIQGGLSDKRG